MNATSRGLALAAAVVAAAGAAVIARADDAPSRAAAAEGGLAIAPSLIERTAATGAGGTVTVRNTSKRALVVTVKARPWTQSRTGAVVANRAKTLTAVSVSAESFTLAPNTQQDVEVALRGTPARGSLYGALEIVGLPENVEKSKGVVVGYRLISVLRMNPATPTYSLTGGAVKVTGAGSKRALALTVKNTGTTANPVSGSVLLAGPLGTRSGALAEQRILPGKSVQLSLGSLKGLPAGTYRATVELQQVNRTIATVRKTVRVR